MKSLVFVLTFIVASCQTGTVYANGPWNRMFQNIKLPSQAVMEHYSWAIPIGSSTSQVGSGVAISSVANTTITTFSAQPDYPKNILLTPTGTTANVNAGTAVVNGLNIYGKSISENFSISATQSTATTGAKAFKSVSSVVFPMASSTGVTLSIGTGTKLGVPWCSDQAGEYVFSEFNNAFETTRGTFAVDSTHVESNTFIPNGSMDGTKPVDFFYVQNFRCYGN